MSRLLYCSCLIFLMLAVLLPPASSHSQALSWTNVFRGGGSDFVYGVAYDGVDNVYFGGSFQADLNFFPALNSVGLSDGFVAKINSGGGVLWAKQIAGTENQGVLDTAADGAANAYATGLFNGTTDFSGTMVASSGGGDVFVARYTPGGALSWVRTFGGPDFDAGNSITVHDDAVYVAGEMTDSIVVDGNTFVGAGGADVFVVCYDTSGTFQWAVTAGAPTNDQGHGVTTDAAGNVFVCGAYSGTASFGANMTSSQGSFDAFIAKYDNTGNNQWVRSGGGTNLDRAYDIAVNTLGVVFATGQFFGTATFDGAGTASVGGYDVFLWAEENDGTFSGLATGGGPMDDIGWGVTVDASENLLLAGEFRMAMTFGLNGAIASHGENDAFLLKISPGPVYEWIVEGGGTALDAAYAVTTGGTNVYIGGAYSGVAHFQNNVMTSLGGWDGFIASYECDYTLPVRPSSLQTLALQQNVPNPFGIETSIAYRVSAPVHARLSIYDVTGRLVRTLVDERVEADADHVVTWDGRTSSGALAGSGVYFCRLWTPAGSQTRKMMLAR